MSYPHNARSVAIGAAMQAARIIMDHFGKPVTISEKGQHDFVTEVDKGAERKIIECIQRAFPEHEILAEESGQSDSKNDCRWIIDPLDGTTNFLHQIPMFAVSIALEVSGELVLGVVYDPLRKELFTAEKGKGATLNDRPINVTDTGDISRCVLATGFPFREYRWVDEYLKILRTFMLSTAGLRRPGAAALDLCYLAAGRVDGFFEFNLHSWDIAAGIVLIREAGGVVSDMSGGMDFMQSGNILGSNGKIHQWMLDSIRQVAPTMNTNL